MSCEPRCIHTDENYGQPASLCVVCRDSDQLREWLDRGGVPYAYYERDHIPDYAAWRSALDVHRERKPT